MKKLFILLCILFTANNLQAQEPFKIEKVITTDSIGKAALFASINQWFASSYNSAKDVIQMADKDAGIIVGNGSTEFSQGGMMYSAYKGFIKYTINIKIKDNRYKVEINNIRHENLPGRASDCSLGMITTDEKYPRGGGLNKSAHNKVWKNIKETMTNYANALFNSLEKHTQNAKSVVEEEDW